MKKIIMMGSIGAVILIISAMLPSIVDAQTIQPKESRISIIQNIKDRIIDNTQMSGGFFSDFIVLLLIIFLSIFGGPWAP